MRELGNRVFGRTSEGQTFGRLDDVMDHREVASTTAQAQDVIMGRNPGMLILELVSGYDEGVTNVEIRIHGSASCPTGLRPGRL